MYLQPVDSHYSTCNCKRCKAQVLNWIVLHIVCVSCNTILPWGHWMHIIKIFYYIKFNRMSFLQYVRHPLFMENIFVQLRKIRLFLWFLKFLDFFKRQIQCIPIMKWSIILMDCNWAKKLVSSHSWCVIDDLISKSNNTTKVKMLHVWIVNWNECKNKHKKFIKKKCYICHNILHIHTLVPNQLTINGITFTKIPLRPQELNVYTSLLPILTYKGIDFSWLLILGAV